MERNFQGFKINGIFGLLLQLVFLGGSIACFAYSGQILPELLVTCGTILSVFFTLCFFSYLLIEPNEACAILLFGKYKGTVKENGFFCVNPFYTKKKLSQRAHNLDVNPIKVNDKQGNPIMIGLVLVWKIENTYKALFEVEVDSKTETPNQVGGRKRSYDKFVTIQSDAALRKIAGIYSYDSIDGEHNEHTLRGGGEEINHHLENELQDRLSIAGIKIIEARINYLAYSPEIAGAMLRRQQASAIISAREKIVEGAVSMVQLALTKLAEDKVVDLDEDKKAAMVSNLMVVLCADEAAQPVLNTGTLYQ